MNDPFHANDAPYYAAVIPKLQRLRHSGRFLEHKGGKPPPVCDETGHVFGMDSFCVLSLIIRRFARKSKAYIQKLYFCFPFAKICDMIATG